ncbi:MAG: daunorubicin resistance protein DrrA family ABC transporter ATP-binding protein [Acidimicrobiales bacterium]
MDGHVAIEARGLERRFGDLDAVAGIDLAVAPGEIYGFLGPNGAGKSTTVRMLCTLLLPTGGTATVAGHDVAREADAVRLRIGVALQDAALDDKQTGRELLRLQGRLYGLRPAAIDRRVTSLADLVDIGDALDRRIATYSGGMKRRLDLAAALVHDPVVLFLDEPTTGLDPVSRARVWDEVRRLNADLGMTIFLTTQYLEEADQLADRVGIINAGRIVAEGTPAELKRAIGEDLVVVEVEGDADVAVAALADVDAVTSVHVTGHEVSARAANGAGAVSPVALALGAAGVRVKSLTLRTPTLDDVFLELTGNRIQPTEEDTR